MSLSNMPAIKDAAAIDDMMKFLHYAHQPSTGYKGLVVFRIAMPDGSEQIRSVEVDPKLGVKVDKTIPTSSKPTCECSCSSKTFFDIYENRVHPRSAVMSGSLKVHGFAFRELGKFGASFDTRTEKWNEYYAHLKEIERKAAEAATRAAAEAAESARSTAVAANHLAPNMKNTAPASASAPTTPLTSRIRSYTFALTPNASSNSNPAHTSNSANSVHASSSVPRLSGIKGVAQFARDQAVNWLFRGTLAAAHQEQRVITRMSQLANAARTHIRANGPALQSVAAAVGTALFLEMNPISSQPTTSSASFASKSNSPMLSASVPYNTPGHQHDHDTLFPRYTPYSPTLQPNLASHTIPAPWQLSSGNSAQDALGAMTEGLPLALREEILAASTPMKPITQSQQQAAPPKPAILSWLSAKKQKLLEMASQQRADEIAKSFPQRVALYLSRTTSDTFGEDHTTTPLRPPLSQIRPQVMVTTTASASNAAILPGLRQPLIGDFGTSMHAEEKLDGAVNDAVRARGRGIPFRIRVQAENSNAAPTPLATAATAATMALTGTTPSRTTTVFPSLQQPPSADRYLNLFGDSGGF